VSDKRNSSDDEGASRSQMAENGDTRTSSRERGLRDRNRKEKNKSREGVDKDRHRHETRNGDKSRSRSRNSRIRKKSANKDSNGKSHEKKIDERGEAMTTKTKSQSMESK